MKIITSALQNMNIPTQFITYIPPSLAQTLMVLTADIHYKLKKANSSIRNFP